MEAPTARSVLRLSGPRRNRGSAIGAFVSLARRRPVPRRRQRLADVRVLRSRHLHDTVAAGRRGRLLLPTGLSLRPCRHATAPWRRRHAYVFAGASPDQLRDPGACLEVGGGHSPTELAGRRNDREHWDDAGYAQLA